jgi:hypothetical protein
MVLLKLLPCESDTPLRAERVIDATVKPSIGFNPVRGFSLKSLSDLLRLDASLRARREELDSLLGGVYAVALLASTEKWPWI